MSGFRSSPPRTTSIENFLDLDAIMSSSNMSSSANTGVSSMDNGFPPQNVNSNFVEQMTNENYERDQVMRPVQNKIRSTNPSQLQMAINGGSMPSRESFQEIQLGPVARQNLALSEGYVDAPKPRPQIASYPQHASVPQNSAKYSNYSIEGYTPQFNCLDVANHIQKCPLCSKFYDNDRSAYWAAIVLLSLACLYLLKKIMDGKK